MLCSLQYIYISVVKFFTISLFWTVFQSWVSLAFNRKKNEYAFSPVFETKYIIKIRLWMKRFDSKGFLFHYFSVHISFSLKYSSYFNLGAIAVIHLGV